MLQSFRRARVILAELLFLAICYLGLAQQGKCRLGDLGRYCEDLYEEKCSWRVGKAQECWPTRDECHNTCGNTGVCACDYGFSPKDSCISAPGTPITLCSTHYKCKRDNAVNTVKEGMKLMGDCFLQDQEKCASLPYCDWELDETATAPPSSSPDETPPPSSSDETAPPSSSEESPPPSSSPSAALVSSAGGNSNNENSSSTTMKSSSMNSGSSSSSSSSSSSKSTRAPSSFVLFGSAFLLVRAALFF